MQPLAFGRDANHKPGAGEFVQVVLKCAARQLHGVGQVFKVAVEPAFGVDSRCNLQPCHEGVRGAAGDVHEVSGSVWAHDWSGAPLRLLIVLCAVRGNESEHGRAFARVAGPDSRRVNHNEKA